jgi:hypothetical protein
MTSVPADLSKAECFDEANEVGEGDVLHVAELETDE